MTQDLLTIKHRLGYSCLVEAGYLGLMQQGMHLQG